MEPIMDRGRVVDVVRGSTLLQIDRAIEEAREISGVASTPAPDRYGDVVNPLGVRFRTPLPLLVGHDHQKTVGSVILGKPSQYGIAFRAVIAKIAQDGPLKTLCDDAWQAVKAGLLRSVSIGFRPLESEPIDGGSVRYTKWEWLELSLVSIPANVDAAITEMKSLTLAEQVVERQLAQWRAENPRPQRKPCVVVRLADPPGASRIRQG
ncbi:HK97 family phage prohead protease [Paraburkholderia sp. EG286A]|uniref:HK97 family phage prohead protease n=1 Tax=Paraburkholderia sp. EG286A TaxID=3237014 RepID=UPI0034D286AC